MERKAEYNRPELIIVKMMSERIMVKPSKPEEGHIDDPLSKENMSWDDSEAPIFEAHHNKLWDE